MKLYIIKNKGIFGDQNSHPIPATVEIIPRIETGVAFVNDSPVGITNGTFRIEKLRDGFNTIKVGDVCCERLICTSQSGVQRAHALGDVTRELLPLIDRIENIEKTVERLDSKLKNQDFFA